MLPNLLGSFDENMYVLGFESKVRTKEQTNEDPGWVAS